MRTSISIVLLALALACSVKSEEPVPLLEPFESRMSLSDVKTSLPHLRWREESVRRGEVDALIARADGFEYLGFSGSVRLVFYDDLLVAAEFYPKSFDEFLNHFRTVEGRPDLSHGDHFTKGGAEVWLFNRKADQRVGWRDVNLSDSFVDSD